MAYCSYCGAYIPDGHSKCLACGKEKDTSGNGAYEYKEAKASNTDFLKKQLEEQRRRQQENSRKWAEAEKAQREKARSYTESYNASTRSSGINKNDLASVDGSKILSAMSYFGSLFVVPYIVSKNDDFALFHAKQGMILFLAGLIAQVIGSLIGLRWLVTIAKIFFIYKGVTSVLKGRKDKLPYIGGLL